MKSILFYILIISPLLINGQCKTLKEMWPKIDSAQQINDHRSIINYALKVDTAEKYYPRLLNLIASSYARIGNIDSAFYFLYRSIDEGFIMILTIYEPEFKLLHNDNRWEKITELHIKKYMSKNDLKDQDLIMPLIELGYNDMLFREEIQNNNFKKSNGADSAYIDSITAIQMQYDSLNRIKLDKYINEYGWPDISLVGKGLSLNAFLVIQHAPLEYQKKYLPMFENAVKRKQADPVNYAYLVDRIAMYEGEKQIYGTQLHYNSENILEVYPIKDKKNVDKKRAEVGLGSLKKYLKIMGIDNYY